MQADRRSECAKCGCVDCNTARCKCVKQCEAVPCENEKCEHVHCVCGKACTCGINNDHVCDPCAAWKRKLAEQLAKLAEQQKPAHQHAP